MTCKKGASFLLLLLASAVLAKKPFGRDKEDPKIIKTLMKNCKEKGYTKPVMSQIQSIFSSSTWTDEGDNKKPKFLLQTFLKIMDSATGDKNKADLNLFPVDLLDNMSNKMWNCSNLPAMVKKMNSTSESSACYLRAFMAPWCMKAVTKCDNFESDDHKALLWCAKMPIPGKPFLNLISNIKDQNMKPTMKMLQCFCNSCNIHKTKVDKWIKKNTLQNKFNCTTEPSDSSSRIGIKDSCKAEENWLDSKRNVGCLISFLKLKKKLPKCLPCLASLSSHKNETINSLDEEENKTWCQTQAAYWVKKTEGKLPVFEKLRSTIQGFGCKWIANLTKPALQEWIKAFTNSSQRFAKIQARCSAYALFDTLTKIRSDYFQTITEEELDAIPTLLLLYLWPSKVKELPDSVCPKFIEKMGNAKLTLLPPRERSRRALAEKALHCLTINVELSELTEDDVVSIGPLLCDQTPSTLSLMSKDVRSISLQMMTTCQNIPQAHKPALLDLLYQTFGNLSTWSFEMMEDLGPFVLMDDETLSSLPYKPWLSGVFKYLIEKRPIAESEKLKKKLVQLDISTIAADSKLDLDEVVPTESLIGKMATNCYWSPSQLDLMSTSTFEATVEIFGDCPSYSAAQLTALTTKIAELFGPASKMDPCDLVLLGCIARGFSNSELEVLPFTLNSLKHIAHCNWTEPQMESVWKSVKKQDNLTAETLDAADIVQLDQFIAGLSSSELGQINRNTFRAAAGELGCFALSEQKKQQLRRLAVAAEGEPGNWTTSAVCELVSIIPHLNPDDCASLKDEGLQCFRKECIPLISQQCFKRFSENQLRAFGPDNAENIANSQHAILSKEQQAALEEAQTGWEALPRNSDTSGGQSLSVEGILAFMKPLFFLLMGFLLL